ncbi:MAG: hypothetical protein WAS55_08565 [Saprospiraceae bacterium]|nr:hypothetical protein [Saprospiraceae bacterium]MBK8483404.1 hypothetical protein [Saprospiraceae bacterium]MBK9220915.1 hypothetical protein [Saprospiraceae bacterium]MBK9729261.1 hypothetical protein [Saprospiraceae bacterium]
MEQAVQTFKDLKKGVLTERSKDLLLALLIAIIGLAGSYLVLGKSIQDPIKDDNASYIQPTFEMNASNNSEAEEKLQKVNYQFQEENILVQGTMFVGDVTRITNLKFDEIKIYMIDFGNGNKHRMTSPSMSMRYNSPGLYLVQCYQMIDTKWQLLSAETITIRKDNKNDL